ncbi:hypothetical protein KP509_39G043900 [Ceratopteris richardii]|uniref:LysM domain-containing protein n=1 Tax=Ceratopteris richardii TaxID=49495 RepID=A0A8T2Q124_CERRI|nr:hypothetical protein KP509_39G043900 [Ceratopteris richardii]
MLREGFSPSSSDHTAAEDTYDGKNFIEHQVSNLDTLAGLAIKYGVEVADIKRANGLATDLHMFGRRTLKIPLYGRVVGYIPPKSPQWRETSRPLEVNSKSSALSPNVFGSNERGKKPVSSAMNMLRGYYGLSSPTQNSCSKEDRELLSYQSENEDCSEDEPWSPMTPHSNSRNGSVSGFGVGSIEKVSEQLVRRRSKADGTNPLVNGSEVDIKKETDYVEELVQSSHGLSNGIESLGVKVIGCAKAIDGALISAKIKDEPLSRVKKSMSTSNLHDQGNVHSSIFIEKNGIKTDIKSGNFIPSRSLFEGLSKPAIPRYKKALD